MSILPKLIYSLNGVPIIILVCFVHRNVYANYKMYMDLYIEMYMLIIKCIWKSKVSKIINTIFKKKNKVGGLSLTDFKVSIKLQ